MPAQAWGDSGVYGTMMPPGAGGIYATQAAYAAPQMMSLSDNPFMTQKDLPSTPTQAENPIGEEIFTKGDLKHKVDYANWAGMDVTIKMNQLIEAHGLENPTAGLSLMESFGEPARKGVVKMLKVAKGDRSLTFEEDKRLQSVFNLKPLFEETWAKAARPPMEEAIDDNDNQRDPVGEWILGYAPDGSRRIDRWNHDPQHVEVAPDGTVVNARRAQEAKMAASAPVLANDELEAGQERWFDAANTEHTSHQQMLASRYFRELCSLVDAARQDPMNRFASDIMWTNDPKVFPLPRAMRAEGREGLPPWEQGIMPYSPDQRNFFVPNKPKLDSYSIDVYIADWDHLFPSNGAMHPGGKPPQQNMGPGLQYRCVCTTGIGTDVTAIVETDMVDPNRHNGFHEWGRLDDYRMPLDYSLPDALEAEHQTRALDHIPANEQDEFGLKFYIVDQFGHPVSEGLAPPHWYYDWNALRNYSPHMGMNVRRCSKWMAVQMAPLRGTGIGNPVNFHAPNPILWVQVRLYAGEPATRKTHQNCCHAPACCAPGSGKGQGQNKGNAGAPEDGWDLRPGGVDGEASVFGPMPGAARRVVVDLQLGDPIYTVKEPGGDFNVPLNMKGKVVSRSMIKGEDTFEFAFQNGQKGRCPVEQWKTYVQKEDASNPAPEVRNVPTVLPKLKPKNYAEIEPWCRLTEFGHTSSEIGFAVVFDTTDHEKSNCGRVLKGENDNQYFVEALNAISCRPKLARQLFYAWDVSKSVYVMRIMANGTWVRVEIDDYVPPRLAEVGEGADSKPFCCYSEHFPYVLWPSLVEKAFAKVHSVRPPYGNSGGWLATGGGGRVEEAMADLTGGVGGRFSTKDVSFDRLFTYFYHLQRYCIWVARANKASCQRHGVILHDGLPSYVVNRAHPFQGETYIQVLAAGNLVGIDGGGLSTFSVPLELQDMFPEKPGSGYFWVHALDFAEYFDQIFECRLTNSPDVGLKDMPEFPLPMRLNLPVPPGSKSVGPNLFKEIVVANKGLLTSMNPPEFEIYVPGAACPCEISACLQQVNPRCDQLGNTRPLAVPLLLKVYQQSVDGGDNYSAAMVCKSNWLPVRDSMISFSPKRGGRYLVTCGFPHDRAVVSTLIFRVYSTCDGVICTARTAGASHSIVAEDDNDAARAIKWTLNGCRSGHRSDETQPEPYNPLSDGLRVPVSDEEKQQCCIM